MAISSAQVKSLREQEISSREPQEAELSGRSARRSSPFELMQQTVRYEKYCKYWSILSNVAAIVSVASAIYAVTRKSSWF